MKVGLIGLGNMGSGIARNLIKAGHDLTVYNRTRSRAEPFGPLGARIAETPSEAAVDAEVLMTMLADDAAVEAVIFAPGNAIQELPAGAVHISMSTIGVHLSRRLAKAHSKEKQHYLAAPVFGRPYAAAAAKLFIVASVAAKQIDFCRPLFDAIGQVWPRPLRLAASSELIRMPFWRSDGITIRGAGLSNLREYDCSGQVRTCGFQIAARA